MKKTVFVISIIISYSFSEFPAPSGLYFIQPFADQGNKPGDLPVVVTGEKTHYKDAPAALLISGDGGWYYFEQKIADNLAGYGIPTLGLDSKKYFWNRKSPEQAAADISGLLDYYGNKWNRKRFILIGYSLGAEIVPFIVNRLPADLKSRVLSILLLSPGVTTDFEIHISNMVGLGSSKNSYDVVSEIIKMKDVSTLIIFGDAEKSKVPGLLTGSGVTIRMIPGDHHYKSNAQLIVQTMKEYRGF